MKSECLTRIGSGFYYLKWKQAFDQVMKKITDMKLRGIWNGIISGQCEIDQVLELRRQLVHGSSNQGWKIRWNIYWNNVLLNPGILETFLKCKVFCKEILDSINYNRSCKAFLKALENRERNLALNCYGNEQKKGESEFRAGPGLQALELIQNQDDSMTWILGYVNNDLTYGLIED